MQFRDTGKSYQAMAYRDYDKVKKRAVVVKVGAINRYTYEFKPSEKFPPTEDEKKEIQKWIAKQRDETARFAARWELRNFPNVVKNYGRYLDEQPEMLAEENVPAIIAALDELKARLKPLVKKTKARKKVTRKKSAKKKTTKKRKAK